jgi:hypothetical protein
LISCQALQKDGNLTEGTRPILVEQPEPAVLRKKHLVGAEPLTIIHSSIHPSIHPTAGKLIIGCTTL